MSWNGRERGGNGGFRVMERGGRQTFRGVRPPVMRLRGYSLHVLLGLSLAAAHLHKNSARSC